MADEVELYGDNQDALLTQGDLMIFEEVDNAVAQAVEEHDVRLVTKFGRALHRDVRVRGIAMAKLLWAVQDRWADIGEEDDYYSVMESEIGLATSTIHKYVNVWECLFANPDIPDWVKKALLYKPMKSLLLLPAIAKEGGVNWEEILKASSLNEMRAIIKGTRGAQTSSETAVHIQINMRSGQLAARRGDNHFIIFGLLNLTVQDEGAQTAIERIIREAHIQEV